VERTPQPKRKLTGLIVAIISCILYVSGVVEFVYDDTFREIGYEWSTERYPACTFEKLPEPAVDEVTEETELTGEEGETTPEEKV